MKQIPNLFTLLNLVLGAAAIICILQPGETLAATEEGYGVVVNLPEKIWLGSLLIGSAAVVDFLDGFVARLFKATSELGKQLDSLADVVSFGVAPGMILYQMLRMAYMREEGGIDVSIWWLAPALLMPAAAAYRLGRFNIDPHQQVGFKGVPAPAAGLVVASFPLILNQQIYEVNDVLLKPWVLYAVIVVVSGLMVSTLPMMALKFARFGWKGNEVKIILVLLAAVAAWLHSWLAIPIVFIAYIVLSLLFEKNKKTSSQTTN
jgi:CDP-diacylglycerol--serine O-phosphatidyltransferase